MIKCVLLAILACVLSEPAIPLFPNVDGITHWSIGQEGKIQMQVNLSALFARCPVILVERRGCLFGI